MTKLLHAGRNRRRLPADSFRRVGWQRRAVVYKPKLGAASCSARSYQLVVFT